MKLTLTEVRSIVRVVLVEMAMHERAREIERLYREFMSVIRALGPDLEVRKGPTRASWIFSGEQLEIPELANVDFLFYAEQEGIPDDAPYGMYDDTNPPGDKFYGNPFTRMGMTAKRTQKLGKAREVPEGERRYTLQFQHHDTSIWSKQKFVRALPKLVIRANWYHELAHLITARVVPSVPHTRNFFPSPGAPDYEESIGNFVEAFAERFAKYANSPGLFVKEFPTFQDFVKDLHPYVLRQAQINLGLDSKEAEKWFFKKAYSTYLDLAGL